MEDVTTDSAAVALHDPQQIVPAAPMPLALQLYLDDKLYERVSSVASRMSKASGVTPKHLVGQPEACFAVVSRAITWRLDPFAVAMATYQTPGGQIGFEGKLVHSIIENSGRLAGPIRYEHYGDWSKVQGRFAIRESQKKDDNGNAKKYAAPTWTDDDARAGKPADQSKYPLAQSCGVRVSALVRGEKEPRILDFDLIQAQPRNSTLWATDPMTQICYTAIRRFGSVVASALIMGVPFDPADNAPSEPIDVTPSRESAIDSLNADISGAKPASGEAKPAAAETTSASAGAKQKAPKGSADLRPTFADVHSLITKGEKDKDLETLAAARDLLRSVADEGHRAELDTEIRRVEKILEADETATRG